MFGLFNLFKKNPQDIKIQKDLEGSQNDVSEMKDELPLVNEGLLIKPELMIVVSSHGKTNYEIGDEIEVNLGSGVKEGSLKIDRYDEKRGIVKLYNESGVVIKAKRI